MQTATGTLGGSHALPAGTLLQGGRYRIEQTLGQGGFAITYLAHDTTLNRPVAVKELLPDGCSRDSHTLTVQPQRLTTDQFEQIRQRFIEEAQLLAQLNHPGIVRVYDVFEAHNTGYIVMEYLQGHTLSELLRQRGGVLPEEEAVGYILQVCDALQMVHQRGYLHRDIKPSNIIVTLEGRAVLIDFGAAREYAAGQTRGHTVAFTPAYAPLEQYGALGRFDGRTDLYALGATLYHLVTGQPPLPAPDRAQGVPLPAPHLIEPRVSEAVSGVIMQALGLRMDERPADVGAWAQALRAAVRGAASAPTAAVPTAMPQGRKRWALPLNKRVVVGLGVLVLVVGVALGGWWLWANAPKRLAVQALGEALAAAEEFDEPVWTTFLTLRVAAALAQAEETFQVEKVFVQATRAAQQISDVEYRSNGLTAIALAQAEAGEPDQAVRTTQQIPDVYERSRALAGIAVTLGNTRLFAQAIRVASQIEAAEWRDRSLWMICKLQVQSGYSTEAVQTARQIRGALSRASAGLLIADAKIKAGQITNAQEILAETILAAQKIKNETDLNGILHDIAKAQSRVGQSLQAIQTAERIREAHERIDAMCSIALVQAQSGNTDAAHETFSRAVQFALRVDLKHLSPLYLLAQYSYLEKDTKKLNISNELRGTMLRTIVEAQAGAGQFRQAMQTVQLIKSAEERAQALLAIAQAQAGAGQFRQAMQTVQLIKSAEERAQALLAIAQAQASDGKTEDAKRVLSLAIQSAILSKDVDFRIPMLLKIANAQVNLGDHQGSRYTLNRALQTALLTRSNKWSDWVSLDDPGFVSRYVFAVIAEAQSKAGYITDAQATLVDALQIARDMQDIEACVEALIDVAKVQVKIGQIADAEKTLVEALRNTRLIQDNLFWGREDAALIPLLYVGMNLEEIKTSFVKSMRFLGDWSKRDLFLTRIAELQAESGLLLQASLSAQQITNPYLKWVSFTKIGRAQAKAGQAQKALRWARELIDPQERAFALLGVAEGLLGIGEEEKQKEKE